MGKRRREHEHPQLTFLLNRAKYSSDAEKVELRTEIAKPSCPRCLNFLHRCCCRKRGPAHEHPALSFVLKRSDYTAALFIYLRDDIPHAVRKNVRDWCDSSLCQQCLENFSRCRCRSCVHCQEVLHKCRCPGGGSSLSDVD